MSDNILKFAVCMIVFIMFPVPAVMAGEENKNYGFDYAFDAYYTWAEVWIGSQDSTSPELEEADEIEIYKVLLSKALIPKFILFEASLNPLPCLGVITRKHLNAFYNNANLLEQNLVEAVCTGFEEPVAFSMLLGNLVSFKPEGEELGVKGKAYMGYLVSVGGHHIKDNQLIADSWMEVEWKIKGERITSVRNMKWSYRIGGKFHGNPEIKDVLYLSLSRGRIDHDYFGKSLLKNSNFEYVFDFDTETYEIIRHYFIVGKSFPSRKSKFVFTLDFGFLWEGENKYTGSLRRTGAGDDFQIIIRPNIVF